MDRAPGEQRKFPSVVWDAAPAKIVFVECEGKKKPSGDMHLQPQGFSCCTHTQKVI